MSQQQQAAATKTSTSSSLERSLDAFLGDIQSHSPEHTNMAQSVVNAVKVFSASMKAGGSRAAPSSINNSNQSLTISSHISDRESALASLLNAVVLSSSSATTTSQEVDSPSGGNNKNDDDDLSAQLKLFREDVDVIEAYKCRIIELQKVINGTKLPGELSAVIEPAVRNGRGQVIPVNAEGSPSQQQNETIHKLSKHIVTLKEKLDRAEAENCQWSANVAALLGENSMLTDHVKLLETEVTSLGKSNASLTKELTKARLVQNTSGGGGGGKGGDVIIGGMVIDAEVALWIKDVYVGLSQGKETNEVLASIAQHSSSSSLINAETLRSLPTQRAVSSRTRPISSTNSTSTSPTPSTPFAEAMRAKNSKSQ